MHKELQDLGLSEKEAKVYLASLEIGRATADQLAKHANIVRPTAYVQLKTLMEKGLISTYEEGKKTYFAPESPDALRRVLESEKEKMRTREDELHRALPELTKLFESAGDRPVVRFFDGKVGVAAMHETALHSKEKKHWIIYSYEGLSGLFSREERDAYSAKRVENNISVRSIVSAVEPDIKASRPNTELIAVSRDRLPIDTDMRVYDDKFSIALFKGKPFGVLIESAGVADAFRATFELLWTELSKNKERGG